MTSNNYKAPVINLKIFWNLLEFIKRPFFLSKVFILPSVRLKMAENATSHHQTSGSVLSFAALCKHGCQRGTDRLSAQVLDRLEGQTERPHRGATLRMPRLIGCHTRTLTMSDVITCGLICIRVLQTCQPAVQQAVCCSHCLKGDTEWLGL